MDEPIGRGAFFPVKQQGRSERAATADLTFCATVSAARTSQLQTRLQLRRVCCCFCGGGPPLPKQQVQQIRGRRRSSEEGEAKGKM